MARVGRAGEVAEEERRSDATLILHMLLNLLSHGLSIPRTARQGCFADPPSYAGVSSVDFVDSRVGDL